MTNFSTTVRQMTKMSQQKQWHAEGGRTGRQPWVSKAGGHPKSEITKI